MSSGESPKPDDTCDSDELDLLSIRKRLKTDPDDTPSAQPLKPSSAPQDDDEPDWVREFSQTLPNQEERRQTLASQFDDDDDSIIDLVDDDAETLPTQPSQAVAGQSGEGPAEKAPGKRPRASTVPKGRVPLVAAPKLDESLVLVQSVDDALDLSGDVGAVGRVKIQDSALFLDIKGVVYRANTTACNTACVVTVGDDEARITSILDEAITLTSERNPFASSEVVVQGVLDEEIAIVEDDEDIDEKPPPKGKRRRTAENNGKEKGKGKTPSKGRSSGVAKKAIAKPVRAKK